MAMAALAATPFEHGDVLLRERAPADTIKYLETAENLPLPIENGHIETIGES